MGISSSRSRDPPPHRRVLDPYQTERNDLLGQAYMTEVEAEDETTPKTVDDDEEEISGHGPGGHMRRGTRDGDNETDHYPVSSTYIQSDDSDILSSVLSDNLPLPSQAGGYFVNPETLRCESSQNHDGPRARARCVFPSSRIYDNLSAEDLNSKWRTSEMAVQRNDMRQCILTMKIPRLKGLQNFAEISSFLEINDDIICKRVHRSLLEFLFSSVDDRNVKQILAMEENVWTKLRRRQDRVFDLGLVNLLLWSYLLCHPNVQEKHADDILFTSEERKKSIQDFRKETQSTASKDLFKAMLSFHEDFPKQFKTRSGLSFGKDVQNTCDKRDEETLNLVKRAKFCDKFTHLYSLIKQIIDSEDDCDNILVYLKYIFPSLIGGSHSRENQTLAMLLVQGCIHALQTEFGEADIQVGPVMKKTKADLQELIVKTIENQTKKSSFQTLLSSLNIAKYKRCCETRLGYILSETSSLILHPAESVRKPVLQILRQMNWDSMFPLYVHEIEKRLSNCGLIISQAVATDTFIQTLKGTMGNKKVIIHARMPSDSDLHNSHTGNLAAPNMQSEKDRHTNNLNMLRKIQSHPNIVELHAYQAKPLPWFYIVEDCEKVTLQRFVLQKRKVNKWLEDKQLCEHLFDIIHGLAALHKQNIVLRDLSLSNFFLVNDKVKIGDLSRACVYKTDNNTPVKDLYPGDIPTISTSPEALLDGMFSPQSDIWSLGFVIYYLWTHGKDPFTELGADTEEIMRRVVFEDLLPFHWPCIPDDIYSLICRCLKKDPLERIELSMFKQELEGYLTTLEESQRYSATSDTTLQQIHARDKYYPPLSDSQWRRHHVPQRGIPEFIHEFRKDKSEGFVNNSRSQWIRSAVLAVKPNSLREWNDLTVETNGEQVTVKEPMKEEFVKKILPHIEAAGVQNQEHPVKLETNGIGHYEQTMTYDFSEPLLGASLNRTFDSGVYQTSCGQDPVNIYLHMCLQVAESVKHMHHKGWLHRNLRAKNFLVNCKTREVYNCRLGGMMQIPWTENGPGIIQEEPPKEKNSRWLPPEAVIDGIYSKAGDVYMGAMMVYEVLQAYDEDNPRRDILCVPYCMVPMGKLAIVKQNGEFPLKPDCCPEWLYNFLVKCWNPDRCLRPSMATVVEMLSNRLGDEIQSHKDRLRTKDQQSPPPSTTPFAFQPRRDRKTYRRSPLKRFRKLRKTIKRLLRRPNNRSEPNDYIIPENAETEDTYDIVNPACEESNIDLVTSPDADNCVEEVIYDSVRSRINTGSRRRTVTFAPNQASDAVTNRMNSDVRLRSQRGRRGKHKKKKLPKGRPKRNVDNNVSSSSSQMSVRQSYVCIQNPPADIFAENQRIFPNTASMLDGALQLGQIQRSQQSADRCTFQSHTDGRYEDSGILRPNERVSNFTAASLEDRYTPRVSVGDRGQHGNRHSVIGSDIDDCTVPNGPEVVSRSHKAGGRKDKGGRGGAERTRNCASKSETNRPRLQKSSGNRNTEFGRERSRPEARERNQQIKALGQLDEVENSEGNICNTYHRNEVFKREGDSGGGRVRGQDIRMRSVINGGEGLESERGLLASIEDPSMSAVNFVETNVTGSQQPRTESVLNCAEHESDSATAGNSQITMREPEQCPSRIRESIANADYESDTSRYESFECKESPTSTQNVVAKDNTVDVPPEVLKMSTFNSMERLRPTEPESPTYLRPIHSSEEALVDLQLASVGGESDLVNDHSSCSTQL